MITLRLAVFTFCAASFAIPLKAQAPAETTSFDEVTARLDKGGSLYLYLSTAQWLDGLSGTVAGYRDLVVSQTDKPEDKEKIKRYFDLGVDLIQKSGIEQISGVGASSLALQPGFYRNTFFVHHYKGKEQGVLAGAFGVAPHPLSGLDLLPADTAVAGIADLDLPLIFGTLRTELENSGLPDLKNSINSGLLQFQQVVGLPLDAVLQSLGGSVGIIGTLDPAKPVDFKFGETTLTVPNPRLALLIEVKDDRLFKRIDQIVGGFPGMIKVDEPALRMRTMSFPAGPNFTARATIAQTEKYLVIASDDSLVRDILAAQASGHGFKASPEFAKMSAGLPTEGNGFNLATQSFVDTYKRVRASMVKANSKGPAKQNALMEKWMDAQGIYSSYGVSSHVENGWLTINQGGQSLNQALAPLVLVPIAFGAGGAIPIYTSMHAHDVPPKPPEGATASDSLENAKQIWAACKAYADDHKGKYPPSLEALVPTYVKDAALFVSPFDADTEIGYDYTPGLTSKKPNPAVLIEDKFSVEQAGVRAVVYADGSFGLINAKKPAAPKPKPVARATPASVNRPSGPFILR